jgi:hypothetical protein
VTGDFGFRCESQGIRSGAPSPRRRRGTGVSNGLCDPLTLGLSQQVPVPLAGDLEMNGWMEDHVDAPWSVVWIRLGRDHADADSRSHRQFGRTWKR